MNTRYTYTDSPLGKILITCNDDGLSGIWYDQQKYYPQIQESWRQDDSDTLLSTTASALQTYFNTGEAPATPPLSLVGTDFQRSVWHKLLEVSAGVTITYGELANRLGKPSAVRAVAAAVGRNPVSIIVPCHRIIGASGSLTGYAGGLDRKQHLLELEAKAAADDFTLQPVA